MTAMSGSEGRSGVDGIRDRRDEMVEEAVETAARRIDADGYEQKVLEETAQRIAERVTRPFVEAADRGYDRGETASDIFLP